MSGKEHQWTQLQHLPSKGTDPRTRSTWSSLARTSPIVQSNYNTAGTGNREEIHDLGFDSSDGFHQYKIKWHKDYILLIIDDKLVRRIERKEGEGFPEMPMFLYASIWDATYIDEASWTGPYIGCDAPYVSLYKDVHVPINSAPECSGEHR